MQLLMKSFNSHDRELTLTETNAFRAKHNNSLAFIRSHSAHCHPEKRNKILLSLLPIWWYLLLSICVQWFSPQLIEINNYFVTSSIFRYIYVKYVIDQTKENGCKRTLDP